jgi:type IV secretion system protein VirD4
VPELREGVYADRPKQRTNEWGSFARLPDMHLARAADLAEVDDEGGMQQQRHPSLVEEVAARVPELEPGAQAALGEDDNVAADQRAMDQARNLTAARSFGINESADGDLIPGL